MGQRLRVAAFCGAAAIALAGCSSGVVHGAGTMASLLSTGQSRNLNVVTQSTMASRADPAESANQFVQVTTFTGPSTTSAAPTTDDGVTSVPRADQQTVSGWVAQFSNGVKFISWTQEGDQVTGTMAEAILPPGKDEATVDSIGFHGTVAGTSVTLQFSGLLGGENVSGEIDGGNNLRLSIPSSDGSLSVETYHRGTTADYNQGVDALQSQVASIQSAESQAAEESQSSAASAQAIADAQYDIDRAADNLATDANNITDVVNELNNALPSIQDALKQQARDFAAQKMDADRVRGEITSAGQGDPEICGEGATVESEASTVESDQASVDSANAGTEGPVDLLSSDLDSITADQSALAQAREELPQYKSSSEPDPAFVKAQVKAANDALAKAKKLTDSASSTAVGVTKQADEVSDKLFKDAGC